MLIFTLAVPKERQVTIGPRLLQQFPKGSPQREIGLELLKSGVLQLQDGATQLLKLIQLRLGKDLQQDVSEHLQTFPSLFRASVSAVDATLHFRGMKPA